MAQLQAYDQEGQPMGLGDFGNGVVGGATPQALFQLMAHLVSTGAIADQTSLDSIMSGIDLAGYSIAIVE